MEYHAPTALYAEENCIKKYSRVVQSFGKKAFILTSRFCGNTKNLALEDAVSIFDSFGIAYSIFDDVEENPSVECVKRVAERIRVFAPEFILAIGGGSALDTAKAANVLLKYPAQNDPYTVFYGGVKCPNSCNSGALPMLAIPTTAGSGSEVMGFAVLTRKDMQTKQCMNQLSYFEAAFLDSRYVANAPQWLLDAGALDALAHGIEGGYNTHAFGVAKVWSEYGFELFAKCKDALLGRQLTPYQCELLLIAASAQGMGVMQSGTTVPHGMGYPLTHFKNVTHGIASAMTLPAFLDSLKNKEYVQHVVNKCGFKSLEDFSVFIKTIVRRNVSITVTEAEISKWSEEFMKLSNRLEQHPETVSKDIIEEIYRQSLVDYIVP